MEENEEPCIRNSEIDCILLFDVTDGMAENSEEEGDTDAEDTPLHTSVKSIPSTRTSAPVSPRLSCASPDGNTSAGVSSPLPAVRVTPSIDISVPGPSSAPSGLPQSLIVYVFDSDDTLDPDFMPEADNLFGDRLDYSEEEISSDDESELAADEFLFDKSSQNPNLLNSFEFSQLICLKEEIDVSSPLNIFLVFIGSFLNEIVYQSNLFATQYNVDLNLSKDELLAFLGILVIMGFHVLPSIRLYWSYSDPMFHLEAVVKVMSLKRFLKILRFLHINDNSVMPTRGQPGFDKLYKIRPLINRLKNRFQAVFSPFGYISIDESMIGFKGRSSLKQYLPLKPIKRGFKVWAMYCSVTSYLVAFDVYEGKSSGGNRRSDDQTLGESIVLKLARGLENLGYCLYFDRFFNTIPLLKSLLGKQLIGCGTIQKKRKYFPNNLLVNDKEMQVGDSDYATCQDISVSVYNWNGDVRFGLPLEIGDTVQILEECQGWYRGFATKNRTIKGIFPGSYIHIKPCKVEGEVSFETVTPLEDPVVRETTLVLREWNGIWKNLYVVRETYKFQTVRKVMRDLVDWRRQLLTGTLTQDQMRELKLKITAKIDWGNRKLGLDLVPRCGAEMVDPSSMSIVQLYQVHMQSSENSSGVSARGTMKRKETGKVLTHHLYLCMRDYGQHMGEDTEIYFSLYDSHKNKYISERFLVRISKEGFANYVEKLSSNCTIFTDLGNGDLTKNVYIIAHVLRIGKMLYSESSKKGSISSQSSNFSFKRPYGVAVLNIEEMLTSGGEEKEFMFKVFQGEDKDFHQLHDFIIRKQTNKFSPISSQHSYGIALSMRLLHGELNKVREENPLLFKSISLTRKLGFSDVIMPGDVRNDLYMTLERGEFERGGKTTGKNIEVTVLVLDNEGKPLEGCLWGASGMDGSSEYQTMIVYHHNSPCWAETIRFTVPIDKYATAHVRLEYKHCSTRDKPDNKKLFGFSFARLMEPSGATLQDGAHEMLIYRCGETVKLHPDHYLSLPSTTRELADNSTTSTVYSRSHKESVTTRTLLCSTKLTQNVDLLSLLQWKTHPERIKVALERVLILNGEELVKFLQDVLDALFSIFSTEDGNSNDHSGPVFHVLVSILSLLDDPKFEHFKPVMDAYIEGHFAAALVYKGLLTSVKHCATWVSATHDQEAIKKCFCSLEYMFKFIIESRFLFARATGNQYEDSFKRDLLGVLTALNSMLVRTYDVIMETQIALLHSISAVYDQLTRVLPLVEVAKLASDMLDSLPSRASDLPSQLTQAKLVAIRNMVASKLFKYDDESRYLLLKTCCKHLRMHLAHRDELRLCSEILTEILSYIYQQQRLEQVNGKVNNSLHLDLEILCRDTLDMLIQTVLIIIDRSPPVLGGLVACLIGLLQLLDEFHYKKLWEELRERKPLKDFLLRAFLVLRILVRQDVFPPDWMVMKMAANHVILGALRELAQPLILRFLDTRCHFDNQVWTEYFNLAVAFLTQPSFQLEKFSEVKQSKIVSKYGDMREKMGFQILSVWSKLGEHKINFIPSMVGPFLEVTLVPEPELRKATLHIFFDMMDCEHRVHGNFKQVESELIYKLDTLISDNKGDDKYRQLFNTILLERVQKEEPAWKENGSAFIMSVTKLLERLLDYRSVIQGDENRDKRMSCTVNLLNFYKNEINRKEMYLRYVYKLHGLHVPADNYAEAGFTLKLYADSLQWSARPVVADEHAQADQPEWHRKEQLYHQILQYFDKGKCWEQGIPLCKELANLYERKLFDYNKLSHILQTQAKFCDNILTLLRPEPEYFRVGFYGLSFPLFLRNKVFIYRGLEYERIEAFTQRLLTEFPSAQIMARNSPPSIAVLNSDVQYIQICNVKPLPDSGPPQDEPPLAPVPFKVARFYQVNQVSRFQLDRPVHKPPIDKENEFKSLWLERTLLEIASPLPGILRWFEVVHTSVEEVPPVQFACETVHNANSKLNQLVSTYIADPKRNVNPLSMRLQGIIDANVMGGIAKYQEAFFTPEFMRSCPNSANHVQRLYSLIMEQVDILTSGLVVHGQLAPPEVQPLHRRLQERLDHLKVSIKRPMDSIVNTPLPPVPSADQYCNTVGYSHFSAQEDDIYSKPLELMAETLEGRDSPPPAIPLRPRSGGTSNGEVSSKRPGLGHQRSLSRVQSQRLSDGGDSGQTEEAPPLPPRTTPDKRNSGEVPPAPPKRLACRKDSEGADSCSLLRDSGYSENLNNLSGYEEWVLPPAVSPRTQGPPLPPPIPPKAPLHSEDSTQVNVVNRSVENYSVPRLQNIDPDDTP